MLYAIHGCIVYSNGQRLDADAVFEWLRDSKYLATV